MFGLPTLGTLFSFNLGIRLGSYNPPKEQYMRQHRRKFRPLKGIEQDNKSLRAQNMTHQREISALKAEIEALKSKQAR